jgi:hypothetical protein
MPPGGVGGVFPSGDVVDPYPSGGVADPYPEGDEAWPGGGVGSVPAPAAVVRVGARPGSGAA